MQKIVALALALFVIGSYDARARADEDDHRLEFRIATSAAAPGSTQQTVPGEDEPIFVSKEVLFTGAEIEKLAFHKDVKGRPTINFTFTDSAASKMAKVTSENIGGRLVVLLDGKPIIAPKINEAIGKECELTGRLSRAVLLRFFEATVLRSLPAE